MRLVNLLWASPLVAFSVVCQVQAQNFESPVDGVYKDRIDWGIMMDMSGPVSANEIPWTNGVQAYIKKVNDAGGILGRKINLLVEDDRYDTQLARVNYERLVSQTNVLAISGMGSSSAQASLMPLIKRNKVPLVGAYALSKLGYEPAHPNYYAGFCGTKEMAQVGVGHFSDSLKLKAPKVAVVHLDVAGGKEFFDYIEAEVSKRGGSAKSYPMKVGAADANAQVLDIISSKPDVVAMYGGPSNSILPMRTFAQYNFKIPAFAIAHLGTKEIYDAIGAEGASQYHFISCFTPGDADDTPGIKEMNAAADKYGYSNYKSNVNFVGGWVVGQMIAESLAKVGPQPTRDKLIETLNNGFTVDPKGVSGVLRYTKDDHRGPISLRPYTYDFQAKKFKAIGKYSDYDKFVDKLK